MSSRGRIPDTHQPIRAVIFDLDGTLTRPYLDFDAIRAELAIKDRTPVLEAMEGMTPAERRAAMAIVERHESEAAANSELHDGVHDMLAGLRERSIPTALLTRNSRLSVRTVLEKHALSFDLIRTREDGPTKPSPEPILALCDRLAREPANTLSVGDYLFDIQAGSAAGARTALMIGDADRPAYADQADFVIRRLIEILDIVDSAKSAMKGDT